MEKEKRDKIINRVIEIVLFIIIIILLLHNCEVLNKKEKVENGKPNIIDITCDKDQCQNLDDVSVDCLKDGQNAKCLVPNFVGKTKKDVLKWLNSISNTIEIEIKTIEDQTKKDGTVINQSVSGISVKDLLNGKVKLVITIVNNGSLVDCKTNPGDSKCSLPNFVGQGRSNVESWLDGLANNVNVRYVYVKSNKAAGTIINQSVESGTSVKDILDNGETIIIYISKGNGASSSTNSYTPSNKGGNSNNNNNQGGNNGENQGGSDTPEELEDDFYVDETSSSEKIRWHGQSNLNIFQDSLYNIEGKIAPESNNTYKFVVNNGTDYNLKYNISFLETNQHGINMKYKLKKGNTYLIDHYVSYDQLNITDLELNSNNSQDYYLEWKWIGDNDSSDTQIGRDAKSDDIEYGLKIVLEAESV